MGVARGILRLIMTNERQDGMAGSEYYEDGVVFPDPTFLSTLSYVLVFLVSRVAILDPWLAEFAILDA